MVVADREALEETLLGDLKDVEKIANSGEWASKHSLDHAAVCDVIRSLQGFQFIDSEVCSDSLVSVHRSILSTGGVFAWFSEGF